MSAVVPARCGKERVAHADAPGALWMTDRSKGLSEVEIEQALGQAAPPQRALYPPVGGQTTAGAAADRSDWRDWLIIAAVGGGAAYALSQLARVRKLL